MISKGGVCMEGNVMGVNSYKERRKQFAKTMGYEGEIQVPNIRRDKEDQKQQERYRAKKINRKSLTKKQKRRAKAKLLRNRAIATGLAGIMIFGGFNGLHEYRDSKNTLTLEQALENGETLENLGINEKIATEIDELTTKLEGDLTREELIDIAEEIPEIQMEVIKTKIADKIEVESLQDIKLTPTTGILNTRMDIEGKGGYEADKIMHTVLGEKTISSDIAEYIDRIGNAQGKRDKILNGNMDKAKDIKYYRKAIKETSKFAAGEIEIDEKGNISIEKTRVSELEKAKEKDEGFGIDD